MHEKIPGKQKKEKSTANKTVRPDTKSISFQLYKEGKSVEVIATERNLAVTTIESHLAHYVSLGKIEIEELVNREKIILIEPALKDYDGSGITQLKNKLDSSIGFGEIRLVLAWKDFQNKKATDSNE
jgi:uncharacterized protein YpbB